MAAVRAAAMSRSPRFTIYSSRGNDWSARLGEGGCKTPTTPRSKGYGVTTTSAESVRTTWKARKKLIDLKMKLNDWNCVLSIVGLILAMVDVEMCAIGLPERYIMFEAISDGLRVLTIFLTIFLLITLLAYHAIDTKIYLVETGTDTWRIGLSHDRVFKIFIELAVCAICPIPDTGYVTWPILSNNPEKTRQRITVPLNVLLSLPMFLRLYIFCRYVVLHSSHYQDCATRTIASLNHISVDFRFVLRSQLYERPLLTLSIASAVFWLVMSWMLTQCERYAFPNIAGYQHFIDYLWFEIITFFSIGYGDIQVQTYCGRTLSILTAIVGTLFSSTLIALMSRRMDLTTGEKRVNHLIAENQLGKGHKHAAACVLQSTWRLILKQKEAKKKADQKSQFKVAAAQRKLLNSILVFRKMRWKLRNRLEDQDDFFTAKRAFMETEERLTKVRIRQTQLDERLRTLFGSVQSLTQLIAVKHLGSEKTECWKNISS